ncbi:glycosyltransferase [Georgenia faecalis]|uniref:Glycosyltransferase n=1 Tax=Georgenia faecalis TaxID=2483799 RepID=A0ABV9D6F3_9MICO
MPNALNGIFRRRSSWDRTAADEIPSTQSVKLCYISRGYPHKNHAVLPRIGEALERLGHDVQFIVTLEHAEMARLPQEAHRWLINLGPLPLRSLPPVYEASYAAIFPSLLESFSVAPLEALHANGLLFASDRPFVRDVCEDNCIYFDPTSPSEAAATIASVLSDSGAELALRLKAREFSRSQFSARDRAQQYIDIIDSELNQPSLL